MRLWGGSVFLFPVLRLFGEWETHPGSDLNHIFHLHSAAAATAMNGAFFLCPPRDRTDLPPMITNEKSSPVESMPPPPPLWAALCPLACARVWHRARSFLGRIKVNKTLNISLDMCVIFLWYTFCLVKCETSEEGPRDLLANWQHKHSHKAARMVYFFWAEECFPKKDKDGSAYWLQ